MPNKSTGESSSPQQLSKPEHCNAQCVSDIRQEIRAQAKRMCRAAVRFPCDTAFNEVWAIARRVKWSDNDTERAIDLLASVRDLVVRACRLDIQDDPRSVQLARALRHEAEIVAFEVYSLVRTPPIRCQGTDKENLRDVERAITVATDVASRRAAGGAQ